MSHHPQISSFKSQQEEQKSMEQVLSPSQLVLYSRINNHLLFHYVPLIDFWTTQRLCVTLNQFQKMLQAIRFFKGKDELQEMQHAGIQFVSLDKLLIGVNEWKRTEVDITSFIQKQLQNSKIKLNQSGQSPNKKKPNQKYQAGILDLHSQTELKQQNHTQRQSTHGGNSRITHSSNNSNSQYYLAEKSKKQQQALMQLNATLIRTKNESHYELAIKVGELNDICKRLKNDLTYVILTKEGGEMEIVQKSNKTDNSKVISQKMFERRYEELKTLNNNMMEEVEGTLEKDLRETLVEVMYLSDQLQKQIALLKRKGINA